MKLRVRELRRELGATQAEIAEGADLSIAQVSRVERGVSPPSTKTLMALANFFRCNPANLIDGPHILTDDELALLEDYRMLSDDERAVITNTAYAFAKRHG